MRGREGSPLDKTLGPAVGRRADRVISILFHPLGGPPHPSHVPEDWQVLALPPGDEERAVVLVSCAEHENAKIMSNLPNLLASAQQALKQISLQERAEVYP